MASQFKCNNCDGVYALRSLAVACCTRLEEQTFYVCPYCDAQYKDQDDAEDCCSYLEIHNIEDYRALFLPLYQNQKTGAEFVLSSELPPEFIFQLAENKFKIVLPRPFVHKTMTAIVSLICSTNLIKVNDTWLEINCNHQSLHLMNKCCTHVMNLLQATPYWSLKLNEIGGLERLSGLLKNNGVDLDQNAVLNDQLTQKANTLHIDITNGEIFLTNETNQILLKINHVNQSIVGLDPQWFLIKSNQMTNQTEAV